jgi:hypothetical protein
MISNACLAGRQVLVMVFRRVDRKKQRAFKFITLFLFGLNDKQSLVDLFIKARLTTIENNCNHRAGVNPDFPPGSGINTSRFFVQVNQRANFIPIQSFSFLPC